MQSEVQMSERNGDRARFQKDRKRKVRRRQRIQQLIDAIRAHIRVPAGPFRGTGGPGVTIEAVVGQ